MVDLLMSSATCRVGKALRAVAAPKELDTVVAVFANFCIMFGGEVFPANITWKPSLWLPSHCVTTGNHHKARELGFHTFYWWLP